jgi:phosphoglycolate phosphatase
VGDTVTDRDTARAAGVPSVLVTFGPLGQSVEDMAPDALLGDFGQMLDVARALLD